LCHIWTLSFCTLFGFAWLLFLYLCFGSYMDIPTLQFCKLSTLFFCLHYIFYFYVCVLAPWIIHGFTLKFCTYFCLLRQCFYACFLGHIWTLHLGFVPIFVHIINVFMFVFWVIYGLTPKFCTYVLFTFSLILCLFFWVIYGLTLKFCTYFFVHYQSF
jgi:hypothetical protein